MIIRFSPVQKFHFPAKLKCFFNKLFSQMESNKKTIETLLDSVYADKKLSKAQIKTIDINLIIDDLDTDKLNLRKLSMILVALTKVLQRRMKALLEDSTHLYQLLSHSTRKPVRSVSSKNITLEIQNNKLFINDEQIDFGEESIVKELENSILEQSFMNPMFDAEFGDAPSIEMVRDSTLLSNGDVGLNMDSMMLSNLNVNIKRRKIVEDATIEISENIFRSNLRTVQDLLMRTKTENAVDLNQTLIKVDQKIESFLNSLKQSFVPVEHQRQQEFEADFSVPEVSFNPIENSLNSINSKPDHSFGLFSVFENISSLSKQFIFNLLIQQLSREEKAVNFLTLLNMANDGKISPVQTESFAPIECELIQ